MNELLKALEAEENPNIPDIRSGDTVSVFVRIKEGENERIQEYKGTVMRVRGQGNSKTFTVRRIATNGVGVERTFPIRSPIIDRVHVHRSAFSRRSRLYYLRERSGKKARLKQKFTTE